MEIVFIVLNMVLLDCGQQFCDFDAVGRICIRVVESLVRLGYDREEIEQSLEMERYDEIWAAYHLLSLPIYAVSFCAAALPACTLDQYRLLIT